MVLRPIHGKANVNGLLLFIAQPMVGIRDVLSKAQFPYPYNKDKKNRTNLRGCNIIIIVTMINEIVYIKSVA